MRTDGFTLIEVLVAFLIAALALAALTQGVGGGLRSAQIAAHTQEALSRARSRLAATAITPPQTGTTSGPDGGGYTWQTTIRQTAISPKPPSETDADTTHPAALYTITTTITWSLDGPSRQISLTTQKLADPQ